MLNIVIFGPPGSGKGTQSLNIKKNYNLIHLSTGDILRDAVKNSTDLGTKAKTYLDKGELVPDQLVIDVLIENVFMHNTPTGFIFDGFPRTIPQAEKLDEVLIEKNIPINLVIAIDVNEDELFKRIIGRKSSESRSDDNEIIIKNRLDVYKKQTLPLFDFYNKQGKLRQINGMADINTVYNRISNSIENYIQKV